ncbi:hypothetical protein AB0D11_43655 [Streptomyces monashensis]|uniref:hypothetical protein n=1 Tax=Streptomyces monashensis TaxID=1678012 RepID=UPI0033CE6D02
MTARRILGTGPQAPAHSIRAAEADLLAALPSVQFPGLADLRARGVLGPHPAPLPGQRRTLGSGVRS